MSLTCLIGIHRPSLSSITKRQDSLAGLCEGCGRPLEKATGGKWALTEPLDKPILR
jgi:hypothetical protein